MQQGDCNHTRTCRRQRGRRHGCGHLGRGRRAADPGPRTARSSCLLRCCRLLLRSERCWVLHTSCWAELVGVVGLVLPPAACYAAALPCCEPVPVCVCLAMLVRRVCR